MLNASVKRRYENNCILLSSKEDIVLQLGCIKAFCFIFGNQTRFWFRNKIRVIILINTFYIRIFIKNLLNVNILL